MKAFFTALLLAFLIFGKSFADCPVQCKDANLGQKTMRVISLSPSTTDIIFSINAQNCLVAVSKFCKLPENFRHLPQIGGIIDPNYERIASLKPDLLIIASKNCPEIERRLDALKIRHISLFGDGFDNIAKNVMLVADALNRTKEGEKVAGELREKKRLAIENSAGKRRPKCIFMFDKMAAGKNSFAGEILEYAGATNCAGSGTNAWFVPQKEFVLLANPEVIIVEAKDECDFALKKEFYLKDPIWSKTKAVKSGKIFYIASDIICMPSPKVLLGLKRVCEIVESCR